MQAPPSAVSPWNEPIGTLVPVVSFVVESWWVVAVVSFGDTVGFESVELQQSSRAASPVEQRSENDRRVMR
jgi:hypothetical protein